MSWTNYFCTFTWSITSCIAWCTHAKMTVTPFHPSADATMSIQTPHLGCSLICSPCVFFTRSPHTLLQKFLEFIWLWPI